MFSRRMIRIKAMQHLYAYYLHQKTTSQSLKDHNQSPEYLFEQEVKQIQQNIYAILDLLVIWQEVAIVDDQERKSTYKSRLSNSSFINLIKTSTFYQELHEKYGTVWERQTVELVYYQTIKPQKVFFSEILTEEDSNIIEYLVKKIFFKEDTIQREMAMFDRNWIENKGITKSFVCSFLMKWKVSISDFQLLLPSVDAEEKKLFTLLIKKTKKQHAKYIKWIQENAHNWDLSRITLVDQIILQMGLTELLYLSLIDPSISINEYLEIAKKYSTSKSHLFIHGLLDTFIKQGTKDWLLNNKENACTTKKKK